MKWLVFLLVSSSMVVVLAWQGSTWHNGQSGNTTIVSVSLEPDGKMFVTYRHRRDSHYPEGGGPSDDIWIDVYAASNNVIVLERRIEGYIIPAHTTPERMEWHEQQEDITLPGGASLKYLDKVFQFGTQQY